MAINVDLSDSEKVALGKLRMDKQVQGLLKAILDATPTPQYRRKRSVFNQIGEMINQSGYREGVEDVVELLSKDK